MKQPHSSSQQSRNEDNCKHNEENAYFLMNRKDKVTEYAMLNPITFFTMIYIYTSMKRNQPMMN